MAPPFFQPPRLEILEFVFILLASYPLTRSLTKSIKFFYVSFPPMPILLVPLQDPNLNPYYYYMPVQLLYLGPFLPPFNWPCVPLLDRVSFKHIFDHVIHLQRVCLVFTCVVRAGDMFPNRKVMKLNIFGKDCLCFFGKFTLLLSISII